MDYEIWSQNVYHFCCFFIFLLHLQFLVLAFTHVFKFMYLKTEFGDGTMYGAYCLPDFKQFWTVSQKRFDSFFFRPSFSYLISRFSFLLETNGTFVLFPLN